MPLLKTVLQRNLKHPVVGLRAGDLTENRVTKLRVGIRKLRRVELIKSLGSKLQVVMFTIGHVKRFHQRKVQNVISGPDERISR